MASTSWIGKSARSAALRGLLLGLVLQALLIGAIEIKGAPVDPERVAFFAPRLAAPPGVGALADAHP